VNGEQRRRRAAVLLILSWVPRWHPGTLVRIPLLIGSTLVFWVSDVPIMAKVLAVALSMLGLSTILHSSETLL
jgi:hypothetical protein